MIRDLAILGVLIVLAAAAVLALAVQHYIHRYGLIVMAWRFVSGAEWDGHRPRTPEERRRRRARAKHRDTTAAVILATCWGLITAPAVTVDALLAAGCLTAAGGSWHCVWLILSWRHDRNYVRPLELSLTAAIEDAPIAVEVERDRAAIAAVTIEWPADAQIGDPQKQKALEAVTTRLAIEAPEAAWHLKGRQRTVTFTPSQPPPARVTWDQLAADITAAAPDELLSGVGRRDVIVRASLENDSPHLGIIAGTGGGKSTLAAFWLLQELRRGAIALILDAKRFSHPWTFKDMDAEYGLLPNVGYCRAVSDLHDGMCWLADELDRRNAVAERAINAKGDLLGDVGPRLFILAEEMNLAYAPLKAHWASIRPDGAPAKSPAFAGLGAVSYAGRAVKMHLIPIGQMLRADILGGGDVRENIGVRMLTRYTSNSWKMQAGDVPMPPPPTHPGRWQQLVGATVSEVQVPMVDMEEARDLAVAGIVTPCPAGMPGRTGILSVVPALPPATGASDLHPVVQQTPEAVAVGLTIREAVDDGIFGPLNLEAARRRVSRADIEPSGQRGDGSYVYSRPDLFAAARSNRKKKEVAV